MNNELTHDRIFNFNNIIAHLRVWCKNKAEVYETEHRNCGGITYVGYLNAYELEFKLTTLVDRYFESIEELRKEILTLVDIHYEPCVLNPANSIAEYIVEKINKEFCEYLAEIISKTDVLEPIDIPYYRSVVCEEASELIHKFRSVWHYVNTSYWFPLIGEEPKEVSDKFFIMFDYLKPYIEQLKRLIGLPETHIYSYGECDFRPEHCIETVELQEYGGCETIYTDKEFKWAIYFSHENTVAFAGSIVPSVKKLLENEKEHWNKFEWALD